MVSDSEFKRLYWASRRGMLELDLMLVPFFEARFRELSEVDQARFVRLLACEDTELFSWFMQRERPEDKELSTIVDAIVAFAREPRV
ncbi:MAG TPA: succinate dehydrogenase assembly factor 2 [Spongiibacteraceae bacterium]|jgi:antitoxin CptB|nr:succinate dehydrogenase assembly factor 2 [Spongiibacteraceae bacterium]HUH38879.1 succinate dehydrogenase assembly factor 2 [Spongiibacteraceae bacterium]